MMNAETLKLMGTLEVLCHGNYHRPILWNSALYGEFSLWAFMMKKGFSTQTDVELAFRHWQLMEKWGTPTDCQYEYAPTRAERKNEDWSEEIAIRRSVIYQTLLQSLESKLDGLQAHKLAIPKDTSKTLEWSHPSFSVFLLVGQLPSGHWLCLLPTVPDQVGIHHSQQGAKTAVIAPQTSHLESNMSEDAAEREIMELIRSLKPLKLYGYYHGGYNYSYQHKIVSGSAASKEAAIEKALQVAKMLVRQKTSVEYVEGLRGRSNSRDISQFMNKMLKERTTYLLSFWDVAYSYELAKTPTDDWLGVHSIGEFEYNP